MATGKNRGGTDQADSEPPTLRTTAGSGQGCSLIERIALLHPHRAPLAVLEEGLRRQGSLSGVARTLGTTRGSVRAALERLREAAGAPALPPDSEPPEGPADEGPPRA